MTGRVARREPADRSAVMLRMGSHARSYRLRHVPALARYACTTAFVLVAFGIRYVFWAAWPGEPYLLFFPIVILAAFVFDRGSGLWAVALSALLTLYFFIEPVGSFALARSADLIAFIIFVATSSATAFLIETMHQALQEAERANEALRRTHDELAAAHRDVAGAERQKDILLQDLAHRMKNDLMLVASLIGLHARTVTDETCRGVLASAVERIRVIGNVHSRLDRRDSDFVVDTREFIAGLCDDFRAAFMGERPIALLCHAESHALSHVNAISVGLIVNELITNALKYAFPDDHAGTVRVSFERKDDDYCLAVEDDGIGIKDASAANTGRRLIRSLTQQLRGRLEVEPGNPGTRSRMCFPVTPAD